MAQVLRGNFEPKKKVSGGDTKEDLNTRFEREALKRLGGSIAFVSKKKFLFGLEKDASARTDAAKPDAG
jgi:hypothetical protein